jgi:hypothetical protein
MLGRRLTPSDRTYQDGKDIYVGGIPDNLQYLWVQYKPTVEDWDNYPIDFTWEREWRVKCNGVGLPLYLGRYAGVFPPDVPIGALIVETDKCLEKFAAILANLAAGGAWWCAKLLKIVSLETVARMLDAGDDRYARIETYPT